jgi:amino acid adenylation domain-containing protein
MQTTKTRYPDIEHNANTQYSPLSFQQERVLYLNKLAGDGLLWNRISCKRLLGDVHARLLAKAIESLIDRHSVLRTKISLVEGAPVQSKHDVLRGAFEYIDLTTDSDIRGEGQARAILNQEYEKPLLLEGGELFKAVLVRCSDNEAWLILKLHHIISDETTLRILWSDLKVLYNSQLGDAEKLRTLEVEYSDYARWLRAQFGEDDTKEQESYWLSQFAGGVPELDLPTDFPAPANLTFSGALAKQKLPQQLIKRVQSFSLERKVIPFSTILSAYYLLLHNYCRQDDIVIGTVFSGRHYSPKIKPLAGFFSNTVALCTHIDDAQTLEEFVKSTHSQVTAAYEMQDYPFERLVDRLDLNRVHKRNPLFRAMFNMITGYEESNTFKGVYQEEWLEPEVGATQVDFFLDFHMNPAESDLRVEYNVDIFSKSTILRMMRHCINIVEKILDSPNASIRGLNMLSPAEEKLVLSLGEGDSQPKTFTRSITELLEQRALQAPEQPALLFADEAMTCGQLNKKANQLASTLVRAGVAEGDLVGILLDRSPEMVTGIFAILKAGAAYLPIDPALPAQRIEYILRDSGVNCVVVQSDAERDLRRNNSSLGLKCISVDREDSYGGDGGNIGRKVDPSSPAYVIYTSGSTGQPKGVVVEHRAVMNTLEFLESSYPLTGKTFLLKTNFTFDVSGAELFGWLFDGGRLALLEKGGEKDPKKLIEAIDKFRVTHINFVPSMLDAFLSGLQEPDIQILERLKYVFVAGEALKPELVNRFHNAIRHVQLENLYGPTEAAIYATWYSLPRRRDLKYVPIGKPLTNTRSYILDENLKLMPVGLAGELCLSGAGLAREYLNQPEMTSEKFCKNPYREGERIYRTGDLAKWGDDGLIQFVGRRDGQVKVRGFRVELEEVERKLRACHGVTEAAVTARTDQFGQKEIVAYCATEDGKNVSVEEIRKEMASWLPSYMIPDFFVVVDRLPRLPNGKIDLQALPEPGGKAALPAKARAIPTKLEQTIITIAEGLLNTTGLDPDSNFFRLGGNSLLTLRLVAALDDALGTSLSVMDFLELPTIAEIAKLIAPSLILAKTPSIGIGKGARQTPCQENSEPQLAQERQ